MACNWERWRKRMSSTAQKAYHSRHNHGIVAKWWSTKRSAEKRGLEFSLTKEEFMGILSQPCAYGTRRHSITFHVGIDRKNNRKGYTKANSVACCPKHNSIKGHWFTYTQMLKIVSLNKLLSTCGQTAQRRRHAV